MAKTPASFKFFVSACMYHLMSVVSPPARADVRHHEAAFLLVLRNRGRYVYVERPFSFIQERHLPHLFRLARKYFLQKGFESVFF